MDARSSPARRSALPSRARAAGRRRRRRDRRSQRRAPALQVNSRNVALVTYSVHGVQRHVLYWGAVNWADTFSRDYSGGWKSKVADYKRFSNSCKPYTGPPLPFMIAACDAPDGSHWALQQWQRLWKNYGGDNAADELYISHWRGDIGELDDPDRLQLPRQASAPVGHVHVPRQAGLRHSSGRSRACRTDKQGRNVYVDFLKGPTWRRVNSFLTHPPTAGFCYTFANHPAARRPGTARARATPTAPPRSARASRRSSRCTSRRRPVQRGDRRRGERRAAGAARRRPALPHRLEVRGRRRRSRSPSRSPRPTGALRCRARVCRARAPRAPGPATGRRLRSRYRARRRTSRRRR